MRSSNANFDLRLQRENKIQVYLITVFEADGTTPFKRFINLHHKDFVAERILDPPRSLSQEIEPEEGTGKFSSMSFGLLDKDLLVTKILQTNSLRGRKATLDVGFLDLDGADFLRVFVGFIEDIDADREHLGYTIQLQGPEVFGNGSIFRPKQSQLDGAIGATSPGGTMLMDDATDFPDPASFASFTKFYGSIEKEIFSYTGKNVGLKQLTGVTRGEKDTTAVAHGDNKKVNELVVLMDGGINPMTCLLAILFSTGAGNLLQDDPGAGATEYDILPSHWGLAVDPTLVNVSDIETKRDKEISTLLYEFRLAAREQAKRFITNEFFRNMGTYPITQGDGRISVRFFTRPMPLATLARWDMTTIRDVGAYRLNLARTYNNLAWDFDWDPLGKTYDSREERNDPDSIAKFGEQEPRFYTSKGMRTAIGAVQIVESRSDTIFFRFGTPPPLIQVEAHFNRMLTEAGDHIFFNHTLPRNTKTGGQGFRFATMEVIDIRVDWDRAKVFAQLQFVSFNTNYALWGPPGDRADGTVDPTVLLDATAEFGGGGASLLNFEQYAWWGDLIPPFPDPDREGKIVGGTQPAKLWG